MNGYDSSTMYKSLQGFLVSATAIGLVRARLSFQVQVSDAFDAGLTMFPLLHVFAIIAGLALLSLLSATNPLIAHRKLSLLALGGWVSLLYGVCLYLPQSNVLGALGIVSSDLFTALAIRLWGDDNADCSMERIVVRLGSSFVAQYIAYSAMLALTAPLRSAVTALLPVAIALLLAKPSRSCQHEAPGSSRPQLSKHSSALLLITVGFSCIAHSVLFCLPGDNSSAWVLGPLAIAFLVLGCAARFSGIDLFRIAACLTLAVQCACTVPLLVAGSNPDTVAFIRSLSYSATMMLAMAVGCWTGPRLPAAGGRCVCRWLIVYFAAFYATFYLLQLVRLDSAVLIAIMLLCLVISALPMAADDWRHYNTAPAYTDHIEHVIASQRDALMAQRGLTPRESEVLALIATGKSAGEAATKLHISKNTVRSQIRSIYQKLDVHTREELQDKLLKG